MEEVDPRVVKRSILSGLAVCVGLLAPFSSHAAPEPLDHQVKAAFLLNFTKFIEWPSGAYASAEAPVTICILGDDPFSSLDVIVAGEVVNGRKVVARRIGRLPRAQACQVVFVSPTEKDPGKMLSALGAGVLTVGEGEPFIQSGGMIAFVVENRRVRFLINQTVAESAGLKVSSKLLAVAKSVSKAGER